MPAPDLTAEAAELESLAVEVAAVRAESEARQRMVFARLAKLRRRRGLQNPLLDFDSIVFLGHNKQVRCAPHMVDQYLGFNAERRGGVYVLERPFTAEPEVRSVLAQRPVEKGRLQAQMLEDRGGLSRSTWTMTGGTSCSRLRKPSGKCRPALATAPIGRPWTCGPRAACPTRRTMSSAPEGCYHIFKARIDGGGLTQLSDGPFNDFAPCFLPSGRIAFVSSRAGGQCRCGERPLPDVSPCTA